MKGYWINHVLEIKDETRFGAYAEASKPLLEGSNKYGAEMKLFAPVSSTIVGAPVQYAALVEFESVQAAVDFWTDDEYLAARALMGSVEDETPVVDRRVCCIEADPIMVSPGQGFWLNHVHEIRNREAFYDYAQASMSHFSSAGFGPVVHQHAGTESVELAAALGFSHSEDALEIYRTFGYKKALNVGGMADSEADIVDRTICAVLAPD